VALAASVVALGALAYFAWLFAGSLLPGRVPLVTRFAEHEQPEEPLATDRRAYTRGLTWIWTALLLGLLILNAESALRGQTQGAGPVWRTTLLSQACLVVLFLGERVVRACRFGPDSVRPLRTQLGAVRSVLRERARPGRDRARPGRERARPGRERA
jgi:uncharacterized membrane protein